MLTAEEYLRTDAGGLLIQLLIQIAALKSDNDRLRETLAAAPARDGQPTPVP